MNPDFMLHASELASDMNRRSVYFWLSFPEIFGSQLSEICSSSYAQNTEACSVCAETVHMSSSILCLTFKSSESWIQREMHFCRKLNHLSIGKRMGSIRYLSQKLCPFQVTCIKTTISKIKDKSVNVLKLGELMTLLV